MEREGERGGVDESVCVCERDRAKSNILEIILS